jgi:hypothetical protein
LSDIESEYPITLPIFGKMSFPNSTITFTFKNIDIINNQIKEFRLNSTIKESKEKHVDLTILVKPKLGVIEKFTLWTNSWLNTMTGLWSFLAGVGAVIVPLVYRLYQKKDKRKNNKLDNYLE